ncbi:MAG: hypothetical protein N3B16_08725 [Candidatus Aminicenantes bacterium]|nr:hypothetical protein [Candidatus Aminicenantes bacterium]
MLRLLLLAALVYLAVQIFRFFNNIKRYSQPSSPPPRLKGLMVKDEICGLYLPLEEALHEKIDGQTYYFCSKECRRRFFEERKNRRFNHKST